MGDVSSEQDPLLKPLNENNADNQAVEHSVPKSIARRLYLSHFLSTWNSRVFEFGAVLYLATIYPGTLLPMSIYAFTRGFSAIIFAPAVGQYIDTGNRLQVVRVSIVVQRIVVATSCVLFYILAIHLPLGRGGKTGMLVALSFLACIEKLCSIMNLISVEKDWLVVVCRKDQTALRALNAQMRRIDLLCKLLGPLFIALVDGASTEMAIIINFCMNVASVLFEYFAIARVYYRVPDLQQPKQRSRSDHQEGSVSNECQSLLTHNWNHQANHKEICCRLQHVFPPQCFPALNSGRPPLPYGPQLRWTNGYIPACSWLHLDAGWYCQNVECSIRSVGDMGRPMDYGLDWTSSCWLVAQQLAGHYAGNGDCSILYLLREQSSRFRERPRGRYNTEPRGSQRL